MSIIWTLPIIFIILIGLCIRVKIRLFKAIDKKTVLTVGKKINYSTIVEDDKPLGFIFGWLYFGYIRNVDTQRGDTTTQLFVLTSQNIYDKLSKTAIVEG